MRLWTPAYGQSKAGRPARTFIQQLCDDTGCNPEDLPKAMNDRETWRERGSGISVLAARHDEDDDIYTYILTERIWQREIVKRIDWERYLPNIALKCWLYLLMTLVFRLTLLIHFTYALSTTYSYFWLKPYPVQECLAIHNI